MGDPISTDHAIMIPREPTTQKPPRPAHALRTILLFCCLAPLSIAGLAQPAPDRQTVGTSTLVRNNAEAIYSLTSRPLIAGTQVMMRDLLKTGSDSRLEVELLDSSTLVLGERAELLVDVFVYDPGEKLEASFNLLKGALRYIGNYVSGKAPKEVRVETPVAMLGVRGTDFWIGPIDGAIGVLVLRGLVDVQSRYGLVSLRPGEGTMIKANGELSQPKTWGDEKKARALAMVGFAD